MKTSLPIVGIPLYDINKIKTGNFLPYTTFYLGNYLENDYRENVGSHCGVDVSTSQYGNNQPNCLAITDGVVIKATSSSSYGNHIVIKHENVLDPNDNNKTTTLYSAYCHLSEMQVSENETVICGQIIGKTGNTGRSSGAHLHFQIDTANAPFHPYWPFTTEEAAEAGMDFYTAVNEGLNLDKAKEYTIHPMNYIQLYLENTETNSSKTTFPDVPVNHPHFTAIEYAYTQNIIDGYQNGNFGPEDSVTRAQLLKILILSLEINLITDLNNIPFNDVKAEDWFAPYIMTGVKAGYIQGYDDGSFKPDQAVNRAEAFKIVGGITSLTPKNANEISFIDVPDDIWYLDYAAIAQENQLLDFTDDKFEGDKPLSRGETVEIIYRLRDR